MSAEYLSKQAREHVAKAVESYRDARGSESSMAEVTRRLSRHGLCRRDVERYAALLRSTADIR